MIALASQWYATMIYWFPVLEVTGKRPVSSVYISLMRTVLMCNSLEMYVSFSSSGESGSGTGEGGLLYFLLVGLIGHVVMSVPYGP